MSNFTSTNFLFAVWGKNDLKEKISLGPSKQEFQQHGGPSEFFV
jgi:hypothetical protein